MGAAKADAARGGWCNWLDDMGVLCLNLQHGVVS
jgi:hypothetical protein